MGSDSSICQTSQHKYIKPNSKSSSFCHPNPQNSQKQNKSPTEQSRTRSQSSSEDEQKKSKREDEEKKLRYREYVAKEMIKRAMQEGNTREAKEYFDQATKIRRKIQGIRVAAGAGVFRDGDKKQYKEISRIAVGGRQLKYI